MAVSMGSCSGSGNPGGAGGAGGTAAWDGGLHFTGGAGGHGDAAAETPGAVDAQARAVLTIGTKYVVSLGEVMLNQNAVADVTVTNIGNAGAATTGKLVLTMSGDAASFQVSENTCRRALAPAEECTFDVTFAPKADYGLAAVLTITDGRLSTHDKLTGWGYELH